MRMLIMMIMSLAGAVFLTACHDSCADLQKQINLMQQSQRSYSVTQKSATEIKPSAYEICDDEKYPCPKVITQETTEEKQPDETAQPTNNKTLN